MKELIKLAKEKGFESRFYHYKTILQPTLLDLDMHQYFWMCELQKWLKDEYKIFAYIDYFAFEYVFISYEGDNGIIRESIPNITDDINDWQEWYKGLLIEALKLI